jgi:hypothetical protein
MNKLNKTHNKDYIRIINLYSFYSVYHRLEIFNILLNDNYLDYLL